MRPFLLAALLLALWPLEVCAQSFSLNGHASVASAVSVARLSDLAFGATAIVPGTAASVAPADGARIRVDFNEPATVTAPDFVMIAGPAGSSLRVDLVCAQDPTPTAGAPTAFAAPCAGGFIPPLTGSVGGTHYIYVGGTIAVAASTSVAAGSYAGTFTVTATYVSY
jgi:spore coat protein U-like protein